MLSVVIELLAGPGWAPAIKRFYAGTKPHVNKCMYSHQRSNLSRGTTSPVCDIPTREIEVDNDGTGSPDGPLASPGLVH